MRWKVFTPASLNTLLSSIVQVKSTADGSTSAAAALGDDLQRLASHTADALNEMSESKQEKFHGNPGQIIGFDQNGDAAPQDGVSMEQVNTAIQEAVGTIEAALSEV